jgi:hypothetical protein
MPEIDSHARLMRNMHYDSQYFSLDYGNIYVQNESCPKFELSSFFRAAASSYAPTPPFTPECRPDPRG